MTEYAETRRAQSGDADALADLFLAARADMSYLPKLRTDAETHAWLRRVVQELEVWLVEEERQVIAFLALGDDLVEHIRGPHTQRKGVGKALLELAKERRPRGLRLWVFQKNHGARRFYERNGFTPVELTDGRGNEEHEPDALYEWRASATASGRSHAPARS